MDPKTEFEKWYSSLCINDAQKYITETAWMKAWNMQKGIVKQQIIDDFLKQGRDNKGYME